VASQLSAVTRQVGPVAMGLGVLGLASFAFLSVSGRTLGPAELAPLGTLWVLVNALGPALFQPLEQEVGRAVAHRAAHGEGARPVFLRACAVAGGLVLVAAVALLLAREPLADEVFAGQQVLVLALLLGLVGLGAEHLTRGAFAGGGAFPRYGTQLAVDGVLRIGSAAVLALAGVATAGWYGVFLCLAPIVAVLVTAGWLGPANRPGPHHSWGELGHAVGWLTLGALASQFVINAAPVAASLLAGPEEQARAGVFISVLVLTRVPLFLFAAIQASFLPGMAALAAEGDTEGFRRRLSLITVAVTALGVAGLLVVVAAGPWLVRLVYGAEYVTTRTDLWPLAAASGLFMLASVLAQTLVSVRGYRASVLGWLTGAAVFLLGLLLSLRLEQRVGLAFLAGSAAAALVLAIAMRLRLRSPLSAGGPGPAEREDVPWT
jgi:O-antigen/teichoic acid export membrane protein